MQQNISSVNIRLKNGEHRCLHGNDAYLFAKDVANSRRKVLHKNIERKDIDRMDWNCGYFGCGCIRPEDSRLWSKSEKLEEKHKVKIREWMRRQRKRNELY